MIWLAATALARPELSGPEQVRDDGRFAIHWTTEGEDAVDEAEVERLAAALHLADEAYVREGWRPIAGDGGESGSNSIDAYLHAVDVNGYAHPSDGSCWLEVDPNMARSPGLAFESVAVHELHHCVQFGYTLEADSWWYEAGATWAQYSLVRDPTLDLAMGVLWAERLGQPEAPIDALDGRLEYAQAILMQYLAQVDAGGTDPGRIVRLWEHLAVAPYGLGALDAFAEELGTDADDLYAGHVSWNAFACARDDGAHYDPDGLPCDVDTELAVHPMDAPGTFTVDLAGPYGTHVVEVAGSADELEIACTGDGAFLLAITPRPAPTDGSPSPITARGTDDVLARVPMDPDGSLVIAVIAADGSLGGECALARNAPEDEERRACGSAPQPDTLGVLALLALASRRRGVSSRRPMGAR